VGESKAKILLIVITVMLIVTIGVGLHFSEKNADRKPASAMAPELE
jgi:flagellar basal body-associated protein FliL